MSNINLNSFNKETSITSKYPFDYRLIGGSAILIILLFVIVAINNIYIFITISSITLFYLLYEKKYKISIIFFLISLSIILIQHFTKKDIKDICGKKPIQPEEQCPDNRPVKEDFYTLFTPFHREEEYVKNISQVSLTGNNAKHWRVRKKKLKFGGNDYDMVYLEMLSTLLLSRARILDIELIWENSPEEIVKDVSLNKLDIGLVPSPSIKEESNLRFLGNIAQYYLYCISNVNFNVTLLEDLRNKKVGIPYSLKSVWEDIKLSLPINNYIFGNENDLFKKLQNNELVAFLWAGIFPNKFIDGIITSEISHKYHLVPILFPDQNAFIKRHFKYFSTNLNLTHKFLPVKYLPSGDTRNWQNKYSAFYPTIGFDLALICNDTLENFTGYEIAKTIFSGRNLLARHMNMGTDTDIRIDSYDDITWTNEFDKLTPADIARFSTKIPVQEGAKYFYVKKGMISYCQEPGCMLTIGRKRCDLCDRKAEKIEKPGNFYALPFEKVWRDR